MLKKTLFTIGLSAALAASTNVLADGLTLTSQGITSAIKANCKSLSTQQPFSLPADMQPNSTITVPWFLISVAFHFTPAVVCDFMLDDSTNKKLGTAEIDFNQSFNGAQISNVRQYAANIYHVIVQPGLNTYSSNITVTLKKS